MKSTLLFTIAVSLLIGAGATYAVMKPKTEATSTADTNSHETMNHNMSDMTMNAMNDELRSLTGGDFDKAFLNMMIEHHQGAIDMANAAKTNAKHDEIKMMADDIISAQSKEIGQMKSWRTQWGY